MNSEDTISLLDKYLELRQAKETAEHDLRQTRHLIYTHRRDRGGSRHQQKMEDSQISEYERRVEQAGQQLQKAEEKIRIMLIGLQKELDQKRNELQELTSRISPFRALQDELELLTEKQREVENANSILNKWYAVVEQCGIRREDQENKTLIHTEVKRK